MCIRDRYIQIPLDAYEIDMEGAHLYAGFIDGWLQIKKDEKVKLLNALRSGISRSKNIESLKSINIRSLTEGIPALNLEEKMELHQLSLITGSVPFLNDSSLGKIINQLPRPDGTNTKQIKQYVRFIADISQSKIVINKLISIIKSASNDEIQITAINALSKITDLSLIHI